jgi:alkylation response protein AidB-like acyl-CoA dehydrogenase
VDFELSDDERILADSMRRLCAARFPLERVRQGEGRRVLDPDDWAVLAEAGVFSLRLPESEGGAGLGLAAASVVFEELGRALVPGPLAATHAAAGLVKGVAEGERPAGLVHRPRTGSPAGPVLPIVVDDLGSLGALLVADGDGVQMVDPLAVESVPIEHGVDPLTPLWRIEKLPEGVVVADAEAGLALWRDYLVVTGALLVGLADVSAGLAVEYAKVRRQFDRPIGSFQAVKHLCADMAVRTELARVAVQAAAVTVDQPEVGDALRAASGAALVAAQAAEANARACIQVHGGMGFTWEVPAHLYLTRSRVLGQAIGRPDALAGVVAERF